MTKILVTGSAGLVGNQVVKDFVDNGFEVYSCYNLNKPENGIPTELDLSKKDKITSVLHDIKPRIIIHLAAITDVDQCEEQRELAHLINTKATEILAREASKTQSFFVYLSTDYVFDGKTGLKNERDFANPINYYGKTKLEGESAVKNFASSHLIIRTSTPFGIHAKKKSFPLWVKENLESKKEIPVLVDQFTSPTYVPNLSAMIMETTTKPITGIIHLAGATRISRFEFATMVADRLNLDKALLKPKKIKEMNWLANRPQDSSLDTSIAQKILDNKPQKIENSLEDFISQII